MRIYSDEIYEYVFHARAIWGAQPIVLKVHCGFNIDRTLLSICVRIKGPPKGNIQKLGYWRCFHGPLTRYVKLRVAHALGMPGTLAHHRLQRKPLVSDPSMHHGTCVTHVPWCMSGSLTRGGGENVPGIPGACATRNFTYLVRGPFHGPPEKTGFTVLSHDMVPVKIWYDILTSLHSFS